MKEGSEFQTDGAAHRKARFASSVLVNGTLNSWVSDECNVRVVSQLSFVDKLTLSFELKIIMLVSTALFLLVFDMLWRLW